MLIKYLLDKVQHKLLFENNIFIFIILSTGSLIQLPSEKPKTPRSKLNFKSEKEYLRQCFLFSNHLIIATRYTII